MDSVTQFALGAGVGLAVLGPRIGARKALLAGGLFGTLPDADILVPFADPVDSFVGHRGFSHSLFVHAAATPILGEGLRLAVRSLRAERARAWLAVFLCLTTHALLDAMTIYGTRLFWPIWPEAVGLGSMFIIDPVYTLPLLIAVLVALAAGGWGPVVRRTTVGVLFLSTAYLGWSVAGQQIAEARAARIVAAFGASPERMMATPTPFNTLFWKVMAVEADRYINVYVPLLGGDDTITAHAHPRHARSVACLEPNPAVAKLAEFSDGYYRFFTGDGTVVMADLRMGLTPNYAFRFAVAEHGLDGLRPVPPRRAAGVREADGDRDWLIAGMMGRAVDRPAEAAQRIGPNRTAGVAGGSPLPDIC